MYVCIDRQGGISIERPILMRTINLVMFSPEANYSCDNNLMIQQKTVIFTTTLDNRPDPYKGRVFS